MIKACCRKKRNYIRPIDPLMSGSRLLFNRQTPFWGDGVMTPRPYVRHQMPKQTESSRRESGDHEHS